MGLSLRLPPDDRDWRAFSADAEEMAARLLLRDAIGGRFRGRIALVSSFGPEAAVLLHLVAQIDRAVPVIIVDTGKLFGETLRYRDALVRRLGFSDVRSAEPDAPALALHVPDGTLFRRDPDACCRLRKVEPLERALEGFSAWINGRKRFQGGLREAIPVVERAGRRIKFNPLARWSAHEIDAYFTAYDLPRHPLEADGYRSIGCMPCTSPVASGEDARAGRWRGTGKAECGLHLAAPVSGQMA